MVLHAEAGSSRPAAGRFGGTLSNQVISPHIPRGDARERSQRTVRGSYQPVTTQHVASFRHLRYDRESEDRNLLVEARLDMMADGG